MVKANEFGKIFKITSFGESHGRAIGVVIEGVRPGLEFDLEAIQKELDRRKPGQSKITTQRKEEDKAEVLSGVFEGKTLGTPICLVIWNKDQRSQDYSKIKNLFRPGHAAYTYLKKYGIHDYRGGGRSSGRETASRVAAGAIAKMELKKKKISITGYTVEVGGIRAKKIDFKEIERNNLRCPDKKAAEKMEKKILKAIKQGDSLGGIVEITIKGCPIGLGEPVFGKIDAELAKAVMSIGAVKGVEFGLGFAATKLKGSQVNDQMYSSKGKVKFKTNTSGGIQGGITNGEDIVLRIAVKPTSSISKKQTTVDEKGKTKKIETKGRHDPCICPRIVPVAESMVALVIYDALLLQEKRKGKKKKKQFK